MQVTVLENQRRPGVGKAPAAENRRAWLPQQARFCPVLEDASRTGFLVYPPLDQRESLQVRYLEQNVFRFAFFVQDQGRMSRRVFVVDVQPSAGTGGIDAQDVRFIDPAAKLDDDAVLTLVDALVTNLNAPPGGVGLRGAHDFVTPEGWDTIYTGMLNEQQRPHVPTLTARVETDWYAQNTEFRYVMQPGDVLSASGHAPVGQVFFVPREDVELTPGAAADVERFREAQRAYWEERGTKEHITNFGALYTYHYRDQQKARRGGREAPGAADREQDERED
jgi:hypothetical protein